MRVQEGTITDGQGRELDGLFDPDACEVLLAARLRGQVRAHVLAHELRHAWAYVLGRPDGAEADASFAAMFARWFGQELAAQGGEAALNAIRPCDAPAPMIIAVGDGQVNNREDEGIEVVPAEQVYQEQIDMKARRDRTMCFCGMIIGGGSIVTEQPVMDEAYGAARFGGHTVRRWAYCCHCHHLLTWVEGCLMNGTPSGDVASAVKCVRDGKAVAEFLEKHPEAAGLVAA